MVTVRSLDAELKRRRAQPLFDAFDLVRREAIELPSALALLLGTDLRGVRKRLFERGLKLWSDIVRGSRETSGTRRACT